MSRSFTAVHWRVTVTTLAMVGFCAASAADEGEANAVDVFSSGVAGQVVTVSAGSAAAKNKASSVDAEMQLSQGAIELILAADEETIEFLLNEELDFHSVFLGVDAAGS